MQKKLVISLKLLDILVFKRDFYQWKRAYEVHGENGLINSKPCPVNLKLRTPQHIEEKTIHLRTTYHLGQKRIIWYLSRYHDIQISEGAVYYVLKRNGLNKLPKNQRKRSIVPFKRYEKQVPGHRIQVDVKFLSFKDPTGKLKKMYQYTAIDDATRARALQIFPKHNQASEGIRIEHIVEAVQLRSLN